MVARESQKTPGRNLHLCFIEFDNPHMATVAMHQLQGYRLDKNSDLPGVKIVYAKQKSDRASRPPPRSAPPPPRSQGRLPDERYESQPYDEPSEPSQYANSYSRGGHRRDGREHRCSFAIRIAERACVARMSEPTLASHFAHAPRPRAPPLSTYRSDSYRDDYEDSERGDDDLFQRADEVSMQGVTDA